MFKKTQNQIWNVHYRYLHIKIKVIYALFASYFWQVQVYF